MVIGKVPPGSTVRYGNRTLRVTPYGSVVFGVGREERGPVSVTVDTAAGLHDHHVNVLHAIEAELSRDHLPRNLGEDAVADLGEGEGLAGGKDRSHVGLRKAALLRRGRGGTDSDGTRRDEAAEEGGHEGFGEHGTVDSGLKMNVA